MKCQSCYEDPIDCYCLGESLSKRITNHRLRRDIERRFEELRSKFYAKQKTAEDHTRENVALRERCKEMQGRLDAVRLAYDELRNRLTGEDRLELEHRYHKKHEDRLGCASCAIVSIPGSFCPRCGRRHS